MRRRIQWVEVARSFKYREARMRIRAGRSAHRKEDDVERRSVNPRGIGPRYILNGVSFKQAIDHFWTWIYRGYHGAI
jgi:hypothetical protein